MITGYKPSEVGNLTCISGSWYGNLTCLPHSCGQVAAAGEVVVRYQDNRTGWGDTARVACREGWRGLDGVTEVSLTCGDSGWLGDPPLCYRDNCGAPPEVDWI